MSLLKSSAEHFPAGGCFHLMESIAPLGCLVEPNKPYPESYLSMY